MAIILICWRILMDNFQNNQNIDFNGSDFSDQNGAENGAPVGENLVAASKKFDHFT